MERLTTLYATTSFSLGGPDSTTGYTETAAFPSTRLIYPMTLDPTYIPAGQDYVTTSVNTFSTGPGSALKVWVNSNFFSSMNRAYIWVDQDHNVIGRISWTTSTINASCSDLDGCPCYQGLLSNDCYKLVFYLEYPYRLVSNAPVAESNLQTLTLTTIVGRHT
jgi:hypothetical protein